MLKFLKRKLLNETGAMDRILVTLLLIIIGVGGLLGFNSWYSTQSDTIKTQAEQKINTAKSE